MSASTLPSGMSDRLTLRSKVVIVGDPAVGKSALCQMVFNNEFLKDYKMTIGVEFCCKPVQIPEKNSTVELFLFDTAGQAIFNEMVPRYWENSSMVMCVYDVTNIESYDHATEWLRKVKDVCGGNKRLPGVLVANKMDQVGVDGEGQAVDEARARKFAENQGLEFFACSATQYEQCDQPFNWLANHFFSSYVDFKDTIANS